MEFNQTRKRKASVKKKTKKLDYANLATSEWVNQLPCLFLVTLLIELRSKLVQLSPADHVKDLWYERGVKQSSAYGERLLLHCINIEARHCVGVDP